MVYDVLPWDLIDSPDRLYLWWGIWLKGLQASQQIWVDLDWMQGLSAWTGENPELNNFLKVNILLSIIYFFILFFIFYFTFLFYFLK